MKIRVLAGHLLLLSVSACSVASVGSNPSPSPDAKTLVTAAVPDPTLTNREKPRYEKLAKYLEKELKTPVIYKPLASRDAVLSAFKAGDVDLVWVDGLTGIQARSQVSGAQAIAQREEETELRSVFIASKKSGIPASVDDKSGLKALRGKRFTFGSANSVASRLVPEMNLQQVGVTRSSFKGSVGFAKDDDTTLAQVQAGTYDAGVMSEASWNRQLQEGMADPDKVTLVWRSSKYNDRHWLLHPNAKQRFGEDFDKKVQTSLLKLSPRPPEQKEILGLFQTDKFIAAKNESYAAIEKIAKQVNLSE